MKRKLHQEKTLEIPPMLLNNKNDPAYVMILTDALEDHEGTVSIGGRAITNLRFADDIDG